MPHHVRRGLPVEALGDETLLAGFGQGDPELAVAFVRRFQARVFGIALSISGDRPTAEDVAQQAFERAWRHAATYDPRRATVGGWLGVITRHLSIDAMRLRAAVPLEADDLVAHLVGTAGASWPDPAAAALAKDTARDLRAALAHLPKEQATAVVLTGVLGLSASEVATHEHIPLGTAKTRIRTALQRLRSEMARRGSDRG